MSLLAETEMIKLYTYSHDAIEGGSMIIEKPADVRASLFETPGEAQEAFDRHYGDGHGQVRGEDYEIVEIDLAQPRGGMMVFSEEMLQVVPKRANH